MTIALTLDLVATTSEAKRKAFYEALSAARWDKIAVVTTLWTSGVFVSLASGKASVNAAAIASGVTIQKAFLFDYSAYEALP